MVVFSHDASMIQSATIFRPPTDDLSYRCLPYYPPVILLMAEIWLTTWDGAETL